MVPPSASEPLAQAVEHLPFKQRVAGSNPARLTKIPLRFQALAIPPQVAVRLIVRKLSVFCTCSHAVAPPALATLLCCVALG